MAMNNKEKAEMERLRADLALARAMRWPSYPKPAPVTAQWIKDNLVDGGVRYGQPQKVARGWFYNAYLGGYSSPSATYGCSDGVHHNTQGDTTASQNAGRMFATKREALEALRIDLTEMVAKVLAGVDRQIDEAD